MLEQIMKNKADIDIAFGTEKMPLRKFYATEFPIGCYYNLFQTKIEEDIRFIPEFFIEEGFTFNIAVFQNAETIVANQQKYVTIGEIIPQVQ